MLRASRVINTEIPRDGIKPSCEFCFSFICSRALDHPQKDFLEEILGERSVVHMPKEKIEDGPLMSRQEHVERLRFALAISEHQRFVLALLERLQRAHPGAAQLRSR